jgi:hypothetical protein
MHGYIFAIIYAWAFVDAALRGAKVTSVVENTDGKGNDCA